MKKYLKQLKTNKKGFTLIEMIVVIAIIGILAAILVPSMAGYLSTARDSKQETNARTVYTAAQAAVTTLEPTSPIVNDTYTMENSTPTAGTTEGKAVASKLFEKIEDLIGEPNYDKFDKIIVTVANGAVTEVKVTETGGTEIPYPRTT